MQLRSSQLLRASSSASASALSRRRSSVRMDEPSELQLPSASSSLEGSRQPKLVRLPLVSRSVVHVGCAHKASAPLHCQQGLHRAEEAINHWGWTLLSAALVVLCGTLAAVRSAAVQLGINTRETIAVRTELQSLRSQVRRHVVGCAL
jgi:hypothetical protein